ncbi:MULTISPECIES: NAD(+) diphosphatase [unclassified Pseudomonas]|uniref:NAD(+) diphosphatase n=1 Tax=unclassified Pseudomonas TaxID=196821 RepID=UPI002446C05D|nr:MULTISPECIES: NAD(+) diphosphatase [unclassified Pseudomonas]MDG9927508.1 NAD(+) diphosphatase [Pseudomonas sp. GD04042]MDH0484437.1 NAD(+) diphosphatase [Pseudomonas sp. GD04015]MDH0602929.1 NAD(+) diphosphatase [Pseudomonas sp. GD03869]
MAAGWQTQPPLDNGQPGGWALVRSPQGFLADANGVLFPREWLKRQDLPLIAEHGLGHFDGEPVWLLALDRPAEMPGCFWQGLRQFMLQADYPTFRMLSFAEQVGNWDLNHRFCGRCGSRNRQVPGERCMRCPECGLDSYARISPSMIVLVTRGDEILLARSPRFVSGMYSTLAGFVEPGESAEECVAREVLEEVGIQVRDPQYLGSQSWPFPHSLMLGFHAEYAGGEIVPQADEIEDAAWFPLDRLPPLPMPRSIARYLIDLYVARRLGQPEPQLHR